MPENTSSRLVPHSRRERNVFIAAFLTAAIILLADQLSKIWISSAFALHESYPVLESCLAITSVRNRGAAWSMLSGYGWLLLLIGAAVMVASVCYFRSLAEGWVERYFALFAVLGGVAGNSIDRLWRGEVVDFIHIHYYDVWHYPVFNIADIAICCGVGVFILSNLLRPQLKKAPGTDSPS